MDFFRCIDERRSCRAFFPKEVEKKVLEKILKSANRSPSYMNSQPWEVFVVRGAQKEALAKKIFAQASAGIPPTPDFSFPKEWPEAPGRRTKEHRLRRFRALGVDPEDTEQIRESYLKNFQFFDAPCVVFIGMERVLTSWSIFDLGLFVQGFLLSAQAEGLGGCPQASVTAYPDVIREELKMPPTIALILAIPLGYPDPAARANQYLSMRREIEEFVRWNGF